MFAPVSTISHLMAPSGVNDEIRIIKQLLKPHLSSKIIEKIIQKQHLVDRLLDVHRQMDKGDVLKIAAHEEKGSLTLTIQVQRPVTQCTDYRETTESRCTTSHHVVVNDQLHMSHTYLRSLAVRRRRFHRQAARFQQTPPPVMSQKQREEAHVEKIPQRHPNLLERYEALEREQWGFKRESTPEPKNPPQFLLRHSVVVLYPEDAAIIWRKYGDQVREESRYVDIEGVMNNLKRYAVYDCKSAPHANILHLKDYFIPSKGDPYTNDWDAAELAWYRDVLDYLLGNPKYPNNWTRDEVTIFHRRAVIEGKLDPVTHSMPKEMRREEPAKSSAEAVRRDLRDWKGCVAVGFLAICFDTREKDDDPKVMKKRSQFMLEVARAVRDAGNANLESP